MMMRLHHGPACSRRGAALLATLWAIVALGALTTVMLESVRDAQTVVMRRVATLHAMWTAEGCAATAIAYVDMQLRHMDAKYSGAEWRWLDRAWAESSPRETRGCTVSFEPAGVSLPVSTASESGIRAVLAAAGVPTATRDSIVDAVLDWIDADSLPRMHGAEADWYLAHGLPAPRNGPPTSDAELASIRGLREHELAGGLLTAEGEVIALSRAPDPVLAALPGVDAEALDHLRRARSATHPFLTLADLALVLPMRQRLALMASEGSIVRAVTSDPPYWTLVTTVGIEGTVVPATVRLRIARDGTRPAVLQQRMPLLPVGIAVPLATDATP